MVNRYVCADLHFGHKNNATRRGFSSVEEHDTLIVENWNRVVRKNDIVYILGDLTMEKKTPYPILNELNGIKYVALGNHEKRQHVPHLLDYVQGVSTCYTRKDSLLTHIPIHPMELGRFGKNIHGHLHEKIVEKRGLFGWKPDKRYVCVSMEHIDYTPVLLSSIL